jgi:hypothetical protein
MMADDTALDILRADIDSLDEVAERLARSVGDRDLDEIQAGLGAREKLLVSVASQLQRVRSDLSASGDGVPGELEAMIGRLARLERQGEEFLGSLTRVRDDVRTELHTVRAGQAMACHQSRFGSGTTGGWCDVRR